MSRDKIDHMVSIWINEVESVSKDAGWRGENLVYKIMRGTVSLSRNVANADEGMIRAVGLLREAHAKYPMIATAILTVKRKKPNYLNALLAKHFFLGLNPKTNKTWRNEERARKVGQTHIEFKYNLARSYEMLGEEIEKLEHYEKLRAAA